MPRARLAILAAALLTALPLAGCQLGPRPVADGSGVPSGDWAVVEVRPGPAGVRDPGEAMARYGQVLRFEPTLARSGAETCANPRYLESLIVADRHLYAEYGVRAADLGLYRWQDVRVTEVFCEGRRWRALGDLVLWVDHDRGYAVREDTLYLLRRVGEPPR